MRGTEGGFTLLELLIAIAIFALLMGILLDGLHLVARNTERHAARLDRSYDISLVQNFLRSQISDARPLNAQARAPGELDFDGRRDRLEFISPAVQSVGFGGFARLAISLSAGNGASEGSLVALWQPFRTSSDEADATRTTVLFQNVRDAGFSYFGADGADVSAHWEDSWEGKNHLPLLVRLWVVFSDGVRMPDLTVALRLSLSPAEQNQRSERY